MAWLKIMKIARLGSLVLVAAVGLVTLLPNWAGDSVRGQEETKRQIIALEKRSFDAWKQKDKTFYAEYWSSEMTEFTPWSPALGRKAEMMPRFEEDAEAWKLDELRMIDPEVHIYGDIAILIYKEGVSGAYQGRRTEYDGKVTMVYLKQNGRWRGLHYHESLNDASLRPK